MSRGGRPKQPKLKANQYRVWYMGWRECEGITGREFTEPIARDLLLTRRNELLSRFLIEITNKELQICQLEERDKKINKINYPSILTEDVAFATQALPPNTDVVACIYIGYNSRSQCHVHTHVYKCESVEIAERMVRDLNVIIENPTHQNLLKFREMDMVERGQVRPRLSPGNVPSSFQQQESSLSYPQQEGVFLYPQEVPPQVYPKTSLPVYRPTQQTASPSYAQQVSSPPYYTSEQPRQDNLPPYYTSESDYQDVSLPKTSQPALHRGESKVSHSTGPLNKPRDERLAMQIRKGSAVETATRQKYINITAELASKLQPENAPILMPRPDYETIAPIKQSGNKEDKIPRGAHYLIKLFDEAGKSDEIEKRQDSAEISDNGSFRDRNEFGQDSDTTVSGMSPNDDPRHSNGYNQSQSSHDVGSIGSREVGSISSVDSRGSGGSRGSHGNFGNQKGNTSKQQSISGGSKENLNNKEDLTNSLTPVTPRWKKLPKEPENEETKYLKDKQPRQKMENDKDVYTQVTSTEYQQNFSATSAYAQGSTPNKRNVNSNLRYRPSSATRLFDHDQRHSSGEVENYSGIQSNYRKYDDQMDLSASMPIGVSKMSNVISGRNKMRRSLPNENTPDLDLPIDYTVKERNPHKDRSAAAGYH